jgi:ribosomal protein S14
MRFQVRKDIKRRQLAIKVEKRNKFFQSMLRFYQDLPCFVVYQDVFLSFSKKFLNQTKNRCQYTFSKHSIIRFYHLGRHAFRANASFLTFYGLQKSSW